MSVHLVFADTLIEDEDLYRFLDDCEAELGQPIERIADGRTPWEVFRDRKFLGNTRVDLCSRILKRELLQNWVVDNFDPEDTVVHVGIDWTEQHRLPAIAAGWAKVGVAVDAPLCWEKPIGKHEAAELADSLGIVKPRLYELGFEHNNCGGFCVKAGHSQFRRLLETMPERYAEHEAEEEATRVFLGKDVAILRDRTGGTTKPLTMKAFREREEQKSGQRTFGDWGGCACFAPADETWEGTLPVADGRSTHVMSMSGGLGSFAAAHRVELEAAVAA